jgi:Tfp pilus assembly protein PilF
MERIEKLKEFLAASPADAFLMHALALEYVKAGNDAEARLLFEKLLAANEQYVGSYYHLGKLLERIQQPGKATAIYEKGMQVAKAAGDNHAYNELQAAHDELAY